MLTGSGLLLEHFARLAAIVMETPAAVVGVPDRRKGHAPRLVSHGLSREQLLILEGVTDRLDAYPSPLIIPDLSEDARFDGEAALFEQHGIRSLLHARLVSPGGERVGFILLPDARRRQPLTQAQTASLGYVAAMILADRQREQRHLHLMHVADRALRVDRMLRLVSEAESCAGALTDLLDAMCRFHGAAVGQIWRMVHPGEPLIEISRHDHDPDACQSAAAHRALNEMMSDVIQRNKPHAITFPPAVPARENGVGEAHGFFGHVCIPIWVHQQRFGISLSFTREKSEFDAVAADIASLGDTIRPALSQKVAEERIRFAANHDDLTQLANRLMFQERLTKTIGMVRATGQSFAILFLDLDGFKLINDTYGHGFGDTLLVAVAQRLRASVRDTDTLARMGGDEFAIIQPIDSEPGEATALARRLLDTITQPFELGGRRALVGLSIGVAIYPEHGECPDLLLRNADQAMYRAKKAGRKTFRLFDPSISDTYQDAFLVEQDLKDAINRGDFTLAYQPVCDSKSSHVAGFEALLRWRHPLLGHIRPDQFIPLAEKSGLIVQLGRWVLETACAEAARWDWPAFITVNLSPVQFRQTDLLQQVNDVLDQTGLPASRLKLEVTEGLLLDESDLVLQAMRGLRARGVRIMLDDFGTAYASMSYLRRFPFDGIKIDKSFVRGLHDDEITLAIVQSILSLARRLDLIVVAEGVETERELNLLRELRCGLVQGYLLGRPADSQQTRALLRRAWVGDGGGDRDVPWRHRTRRENDTMIFAENLDQRTVS